MEKVFNKFLNNEYVNVEYLRIEAEDNFKNSVYNIYTNREKNKTLFYETIFYEVNIEQLIKIKTAVRSLTDYNLSHIFELSTVVELINQKLIPIIKSRNYSERKTYNTLCSILARIEDNKKDLFMSDYNNVVVYTECNDEEKIFLQFLKEIGYKIFYINPYGNPLDIGIGTVIKNKRIGKYIPISDIIKNYKEETLSFTKTMENNISSDFLNSGLIYNLDINEYKTKSLNIEYSIYDTGGIKDPLKYRQNYEIESNVIRIPNYKLIINGIHENESKYYELLGQFSNYISLSEIKTTKEQDLSLVFALRDENVLFEKISNKFSASVSKYLTSKIIEFLNNHAVFNSPLSNKDKVAILNNFLHLEESITQEINKFNGYGDNPCIVFRTNSSTDWSEEQLQLIVLLMYIGLDIVVLAHGFNSKLEDFTRGNFLTVIKLEKYANDFSYNKVENTVSKSNKLIKKIFKKFTGD